MIQTADTAMATISESLIRMKELAVKSANDTYTDSDRAIIQKEIDGLVSFIDDTIKNTEFNGKSILCNDETSNKDMIMQTGSNVGDNMTIPILNLSTDTLKIKDIDVTKIDETLNNIDGAISFINSSRSVYGSIQNRMETSMDILDTANLSLEQASSDMLDADIALEMTNVARTSILMESATAILAQSNNFPKEVLNILSNLIK